MQIQQAVKYYLPVILYMILIFMLSSIPDFSTPDLGFEPQDKFFHMIFFLFFGYLIARAFYSAGFSELLVRNYLLFSTLTGVLYGLSDEIHQFFVPGRDMNYYDFIADALGVCIGVFLFHLRVKLMLDKGGAQEGRLLDRNTRSEGKGR